MIEITFVNGPCHGHTDKVDEPPNSLNLPTILGWDGSAFMYGVHRYQYIQTLDGAGYYFYDKTYPT